MLDKVLFIKILYGAASIQGIFLAVLLIRSKVNPSANKILGLILLIVSFHLVLVGFDERDFFLAFPHLSRVSWVLGSLYGPLFFLFIQQLTRSRVNTWVKFSLFVPFLIIFISLFPYFLQDAETKRAYLDAFDQVLQDDFGWVNQFSSFVQIGFVVGNLLFYLHQEKRRSDEFSSIEAIRVGWLRQFLIFLAAVTFFGVLVFFGRIWGIPLLSGLYRFHFIGVVLLFYWLSYKALTQPVLFGIMQEPNAPQPEDAPNIEKKYKKSGLEATQLQEVFHKVKDVLESGKLFLANDLTLTQLADSAGLPRHQVSQAINTWYKGNFFDLVNDYRLEEFKSQALSPHKKHLNQLGIALESGFSSKASFYAVFKKKTGMTPSEYLEQVNAGNLSV